MPLERWNHYLNLYDIASNHSTFLYSLEHGFSYRSSISISSTRVYANHASVRDNPDALISTIEKEVKLGRYKGPYSRDEVETFLGPFISHPCGLVDKPNGKKRLTEDLSYPRNSSTASLNSLTDTSELVLDWGGMAEAINLVITAPPGAQGATVDWEEAFRRLGIRPDELWQAVINMEPQFWIDLAAKFGGSATPFEFELVAAAFLALLLLIFLSLRAIYWVDDLFMIRYPTNPLPPYVYDVEISDIVKFGAELGAIFPDEKISHFSYRTKYIGFDWLIDSKEVRIPERKRIAFLDTLTIAKSQSKVSLSKLRSLCGKLNHFSHVVPLGPSNTRSLWSLLAAMEAKAFNEHISWPWGEPQLANLDWWSDTLSSPDVGMHLCTHPTPDDSYHIYCDASSSYGIGIIINGEFDAFKLSPDWRSSGPHPRDIGWAEFAAIELSIYFLLKKYLLHDTHILIHTDNKGVLGAWNKRQSKSPAQNEVLSRILSMLLPRQCYLTLEYVKSADNPADLPSRGLPAANARRAQFKGFPKGLIGLLQRPNQL
jgi:hypothetical protein